ncbi:MAG: TetM/TetW/TetO/TetS family tetracycline resistance ribosomal protection protein [bacterium]|nr:TetM/TetW/TetO/TetS family tetracycline resistance ribosomal protection protein [bacterium]
MARTIRNVGIVAHVDAGKTTVTEQLLFRAGVLRTAGSVDRGTCASDSLSVERERGISVRLATISFEWDDARINIIDTPGHVDFCAEIERSLRALDCAVLVLSAAEGVQAHAETIFRALRDLEIPTIIFINKIDRMGADVDAVIAEIGRELTPDYLLLQEAEGREQGEFGLGLTWCEKTWREHGDSALARNIVETIAGLDDTMLERYLQGDELVFAELERSLAASTATCRLYPVLCGVAKNGVGIEQLLDGIISYLPAPDGSIDSPLAGVVFKIDHDPALGKVAHVRLFSGRINLRDVVPNATRGVEEKANQLRKLYTTKYVKIDSLEAGDIGVVCGLTQAQVGDVLGEGEHIPDRYSLSAPLLTARVRPADDGDITALAHALQELAAEDPLLDIQWLREQRELHVRITGWIQIEVLGAILRDRFNVEAEFEEPTIIYRETPARIGYGHEEYTMPKPCWAVVKYLLEPGPAGSGVTYESQVGVNDIAIRYQSEIERTIDKALRQGIKGWEVTDLKITLVEGNHHHVHSRAGDFALATRMAIMNGLVETDTTLLEPILEFRIVAPEHLLGNITSDLISMRATFGNPDFEQGKFVLTGMIPAATSLEYPIKLASRSGGKAKIATRLSSYEPCTLEQGRTSAYRGISPLDRAKFILQARGAITE